MTYCEENSFFHLSCIELVSYFQIKKNFNSIIHNNVPKNILGFFSMYKVGCFLSFISPFFDDRAQFCTASFPFETASRGLSLTCCNTRFVICTISLSITSFRFCNLGTLVLHSVKGFLAHFHTFKLCCDQIRYPPEDIVQCGALLISRKK